MASNRLDLNLLHVFDTIYREGSLTRAARALHLTQPAVSHSLARLRDHFDDPLFSRQGNRMVPTPLARRFVESMRPGLNQIHSAVNQFHAFDPTSHRKTFALALRDVLESTFLPRLVMQLNHFPDIEINSQRIARRDMESLLAAGKLDFAVDVLLPISDQTAHERLRKDRLVVMARKDHPLAGRDLTMDDYLAARHILVSSRTEGPGIEDFELSRLGLQRRIRLRCQHFYAACQVVEMSDLLLTMPEGYARQIVEHSDTCILNPPEGLPEVDVHLYWHRAYAKEPALLWLKEQFHRVAAEGKAKDQRASSSEHADNP
ncbi:DNA-binding transcriptional regulator, LysR family [Marinobacter daqiaonensis]|uniref:DNA-binding transcriptional regulator, LysR family n=1 Tax=Marinobacter daqiaonensis TaxID=650891 RepID=A0A1I6J975_9GAMM|nr:LysR family transcriptional regulator [Marinobacter daqiaonensis]SFR75494.1 DNA-binding transcriptional regulator, LysR family [Marinobacter daqiaonensis]